ncbi:MAG: hypothetical protein JWQ25_1428 [Daejeonella sp.]|nr:hypothetical protein [Daejeonella sp.]
MKPQLQLIDPSFQSQSSKRCDLLIHIGTAGICYAIINKEENKLKILSEVSLPNNDKETVKSKLIELVEKNDHLKIEYNSVIVSIETYKYTFIPVEIFEPNSVTKYARLLNAERFDDVLVSELKHPAIQNISAIDIDIQKAVLTFFPNAKLVNQASAFLEGSAKALKNDSPNQLFINIQTCNFEVVLYTENRLQFYNVFEYKTVDEFNYYLLAIINQFNLKGTSTIAVVAGKINPGEDLYLRIQKYFTKIKFADSDPLADRNYIFHRVQSHTYFSLLSLRLCE